LRRTLATEGTPVLQDLLVYGLGVLGLCCAKAAVHKAATALFARLCPGGRRRRWRLRAVVGGWAVEVTVKRKGERC
jgi:hypothetical protein